jgi:hypothetical protein
VLRAMGAGVAETVEPEEDRVAAQPE